MAEVIEGYDFEEARGRLKKYPWALWADGDTRMMKRGVDFTCSVTSFQNAVYAWSRRSPYKAETRQHGYDSVIVRFVPRDTEN